MFASKLRLKRAARIAVIGVTFAALGACVSIYRNHGYTPTEQELAEIAVGVDTRDTVAETIGVPSASGVLNESGYYYISSRFRHYGPKEPEIVSRELVAISFDQAGIVRNIERFGLQDGLVIPLQRRVTSSGITDKTFLRQLLGNFGRIDPGQLLQ